MRTTTILQAFRQRKSLRSFSSQSSKMQVTSWLSIKKLLTFKSNDISHLFLQFSYHAIAKNEMPPIMAELKEICESHASNYEVCKNIHVNLSQLETHAASHLRQMQRTGFNHDHPEIKLFLDMEKGIYPLKWQVYKNIEAMQDERCLQFASRHTHSPKSDTLFWLNRLLQQSRQPLGILEKMEIQTQIRGLRMSLHPEYAAVAVLNRGLIAKKILEIASKQGYETILITHKREQDSPAAALANHVCFVSDPNDVNEITSALLNIQAKLPSGFGIASHPGYGYLAENPLLPIACEKNNLVFIGPDAEAMHALGNKSMARLHADKLNIPLVPGYNGENQDRDFLITQCKKIGFPVMIKAVDGGGGYGNRVVHDENESATILMHILKGDVILEKYLNQPQHYELQLIIDKSLHDNAEVVYLGSRDCTLQRNYAKIIEVAPAETIHHEKMVAYALLLGKTAQKLGYSGPITVEFLHHEGKIYFNECNTRIQVEHAPTEHILGNSISIIEMQLHIAAGKLIKDYLEEKCPNPLYKTMTAQQIIGELKKQSPIKVSVEVRVNAEEYIPHDNTISSKPAIGIVSTYDVPDPQDKGAIYSGITLNTHVDTTHVNSNIMLVCGYGSDSQQALTNVKQLLSDIKIAGIHSNIDYLNVALDYVSDPTNTPHIETCKNDIDKQFAAKLEHDMAASQRSQYRR